VRTPREITEQFRPGGREWKAVLRDSLAKAVGRGGGEAEVLDGAKEAQRMAGGVGVVEMQAGGWSFTARDMEGGVWVWGQSCFPSPFQIGTEMRGKQHCTMD
jgi:hypothetical protein